MGSRVLLAIETRLRKGIHIFVPCLIGSIGLRTDLETHRWLRFDPLDGIHPLFSCHLFARAFLDQYAFYLPVVTVFLVVAASLVQSLYRLRFTVGFDLGFRNHEIILNGQ